MRRLCVLMLLSAMAFANTGCVVVLGVKDLPHRKHVVEIDGELYVVDLKTHRIHRIDDDISIETETTTETETEAEASGD